MRRLSALLLLASCTFDFDSPSEVKDLRVLGMRATPPELTASLPFTLVRLEALVVGEDPATVVEYEWQACPVLPSAGSFFGSQVTRCSTDAGSIEVSVDAGRLDELGAVLPVPKQLVEVLGSGVEGLTLQLQAQLQVRDLFAVKKISITPTLPQGQEPNKNPFISSLDFGDAGWPDGAPLSVTFDTCPAEERAPAPGAFGGRDAGANTGPCVHEIFPIVDEASNQTYWAEGLSGEIEEQKERLSFAWFSDVGTLQEGNTQQPNPDLPFGRTSFSTHWVEPTTKPSGPVTLWVVIRDGRGGVSWVKRQLVFP